MTTRTRYFMRPIALLVWAVLAASVVMAAVLASPAQAATLTVNTAADKKNTNDQCSLREAMINAKQNYQSGSTDCAAGVGEDTINFDLGSTATIRLGSPLPVINGFHPAGLIIDGGNADITISGDNKYRVFEVNFDPVTLRNLTVANGAVATDAPADGGGGGGGIYNLFGTLTVSNSTISGNSAGGGGGIYNTGTVTVSNSTISGNSGTGFTGDVSGGGGILNGWTLTVSNSTLSGNSAPFGGGILNHSDQTLTVSNSTISGNSAGSEGGGIYNEEGTLMVNSSTISGNSASFGGGGINSPGQFGTTTTLKNTIVAANDASVFGPDLRGVFTSQGHNLIGKSDASGGFTNGQNGDQVGTAANPIDPMLGPLANNGGPTMTHALLEGSPAIDKGVAVEGITTDQRGVSRQQGGRPT